MRDVTDVDGVRVVLMDSVSEILPEDAGAIVIAGSHAGENVAQYALRFPLQAAFFNDAGIGKDNAGIVSLPTFETRGLPAATVSHTSARIGDAMDSLTYGVVSHVNRPASEAGIRVGEKLRDAIVRCFG